MSESDRIIGSYNHVNKGIKKHSYKPYRYMQIKRKEEAKPRIQKICTEAKPYNEVEIIKIQIEVKSKGYQITSHRPLRSNKEASKEYLRH